MAENQKNPSKLDQNLNQRNDQVSDRSEDKSTTQQNQQRSSTSGAASEEKSPKAEEEADVKSELTNNDKETPERKLTTPEKTVKEPTAQPGKDNSGAIGSAK